MCVQFHFILMFWYLTDYQHVLQGPNPWSAMALMLILADGVKDVLDMVALLRKSGCLLTAGGISEYLWAMATLLLAMRKNNINISNRWETSLKSFFYKWPQHLHNDQMFIYSSWGIKQHDFLVMWLAKQMQILSTECFLYFANWFKWFFTFYTFI